MGYQYTEAKNASDPHRLPDVEVFEITEAAVLMDSDPDQTSEPGWYYAYGQPGCLWDGDPSGPYTTEADALKAAREDAGVCEHGASDDDACEECDAG